jgi:hypothetical protein
MNNQEERFRKNVAGSGPGWTTGVQTQAEAEAVLGVQRGPLSSGGKEALFFGG